jgi:hypothetical protein
MQHAIFNVERIDMPDLARENFTLRPPKIMPFIVLWRAVAGGTAFSTRFCRPSWFSETNDGIFLVSLVHGMNKHISQVSHSPDPGWPTTT